MNAHLKLVEAEAVEATEPVENKEPLTVSEHIANNGIEACDVPNGTVFFYRDSDHSYWRELAPKKDGTISGKGRLTGVSTVVGPMDWRPDNLMGWAAKLELEGVCQLMALDGVAVSFDSAESLRETLKDHELTWRDVREQAAHRGTAVHQHALHALAKGEQIAFDELTQEERGYAQGVAGFWLDHDPDVIAAEAAVCDLDLGVAGRLDLLCRIGGETLIVDAKTSRYLSAKFSAQLAGYAMLAEASGYEAPTGGAILQVREDGTYRLVRVPLDHTDFTAALEVYRREAEIKKQLRKAEKEADNA
jgi:hypothetical protein